MREDFFYRIHIIPIHLPPLRNRKDDIPLLVEHFLRVYAGEKEVPSIPGQVLEALVNYEWPGNVRELQNAIQRYVAVGRLDIPTLSGEGPDATGSGTDAVQVMSGQASSLKREIERLEKASLREALERHGGNKSKAAQALGISRKTLFRKLKRYGDI
jgi:transcriptional regulator with PAS, ATPase and Fis domain